MHRPLSGEKPAEVNEAAETEAVQADSITPKMNAIYRASLPRVVPLMTHE